MNGKIQILAVELDGHDGIVLTFSDGTTGGYVVEELLELRPVRERMEIKKIKDAPKLSGQKNMRGTSCESHKIENPRCG